MNSLKIIFLFTLTISLSSCGIYKEVEFVEVDNVNVKEFSTSAIIFEIKAVINNPNRFNITISDSDLDFIVNGTHIGKANIDETIVLKKKQEGTYTFILKADMDGLFSKVGLLLPILLSGKAKVKVKGNILAKVHGINKIAPVEFDEEIVF